jgi:hypothetical protein
VSEQELDPGWCGVAAPVFGPGDLLAALELRLPETTHTAPDARALLTVAAAGLSRELSARSQNQHHRRRRSPLAERCKAALRQGRPSPPRALTLGCLRWPAYVAFGLGFGMINAPITTRRIGDADSASRSLGDYPHRSLTKFRRIVLVRDVS